MSRYVYFDQFLIHLTFGMFVLCDDFTIIVFAFLAREQFVVCTKPIIVLLFIVGFLR